MIADGRCRVISVCARAALQHRFPTGLASRLAPRDCHRACAKHACDQKANGDVVGNKHGTSPNEATVEMPIAGWTFPRSDERPRCDLGACRAALTVQPAAATCLMQCR